MNKAFIHKLKLSTKLHSCYLLAFIVIYSKDNRNVLSHVKLYKATYGMCLISGNF